MDTIIDLTLIGFGHMVPISSTIYFNAASGNGEPIYREEYNGLTGIPIEIHLLPAFGRIGDTGDLTFWKYDNRLTEKGTWTTGSLPHTHRQVSRQPLSAAVSWQIAGAAFVPGVRQVILLQVAQMVV